MGLHAVALGEETTASGNASFAQGSNTQAIGSFSDAGGYYTIAQNSCQTVIGKYNSVSIPGNNGLAVDDAFIIGNGADVRSNAFRVTFEGEVYAAASVFTSGAAYAEMFEWEDGNPAGEDRRGCFVTLEGEYIRKATAQDGYILGVVSAAPCVVGGAQGCGWQGMYQRDAWGAVLYEWVDGQQRPVLNPAYDPSQPYEPRTQRPEWAAVGMMGKLIVRDDGSCLPNGYCAPNDQGVAAACAQGYRVMKRVDSETVLICLK
jgi:hypothetical protein